MSKDDYCTREGAERLKAQIEAYWAERGRQPKINLVSAGFLPSMRGSRTDVRSNMVNGAPVGSGSNLSEESVVRQRVKTKKTKNEPKNEPYDPRKDIYVLKGSGTRS